MNTMLSMHQWSYDPVGNMLTHTDGNSHTWSYTYDPLNRVVRVDSPISISSSPHNFQLEYDSGGRMVARTDYNGHRINHHYDEDGRLTEICYPDGTKVHYNWCCCRITDVDDS